jgi:CBS domain-containing protein
MTLKYLLQSKPSKMITCKTTCQVADAVTVMDGHNVGSILILDEEDKLVGIFTERDIMHCFAKNLSFKDVTMDKIMTPDPITFDSSTKISHAIEVMSEKKIRHLPVTEGGKLVGIVSYRDLISYLLPQVIFASDDII